MLYAQDFAGASVPRRKGLLSSLGNGTVAGSYRYDSWQLQFWDTFYFSKVSMYQFQRLNGGFL
jgi:hypothetical protein